MIFDRIVPFVLALLFLAFAVEAIRTGRTKFGMRGKFFGPWTFRREHRPIAFWLAVGSYFLAAAFLVVAATRTLR